MNKVIGSDDSVQETAANIHDAVTFNEIVLIVAIMVFITLLVMESVRPFRRFDSNVNKDSVVTNTAAFLFNNLTLTVLRASSLFYIAQQFAGVGLLATLESGPFKWLLSFLLFDFAVYLWHIANHKYEALWRFHKIHHSDRSFNVTTGLRFHVFDLLLDIFYKCFLVVLFGIEAYVVLAIEIIELSFVFFHHSNLSFSNEGWLSKFIITPNLHRTHHSTVRAEHDSNYGIVLSVWDRLFGTRKELIPEKFGLDVIEAENFVQLFFLAFVTENRMKKLLGKLPRGRRR